MYCFHFHSKLSKPKAQSSDCFLVLTSCLANSSIRKKKAASSSETSVNFYNTKRRQIPEDSTLEEIPFYRSEERRVGKECNLPW
jgi:hypothetical protein